MVEQLMRSHKRMMLSDNLFILLKSLGKKHTVSKGHSLYQEGEKAEYVYLIHSGLIQLSKLTSDGKELTLRLCQQHDVCGELALFSEEPKYMLSAWAMEDSEVFLIRQEDIEKALRQNAELSLDFMRWVTTQMRISQTKIRDLVMNGKKGALYSTLIRLSNSYGYSSEEGVCLGIQLTNQELAGFCATTRESVNRMLSDLRKKGVVDRNEAGELIIRNMEYLRMEIGCDACPVHICTID